MSKCDNNRVEYTAEATLLNLQTNYGRKSISLEPILPYIVVFFNVAYVNHSDNLINYGYNDCDSIKLFLL